MEQMWADLEYFKAKLSLRIRSRWVERFILGTKQAVWKDKENIPEGSHWTRHHCHLVWGSENLLTLTNTSSKVTDL